MWGQPDVQIPFTQPLQSLPGQLTGQVLKLARDAEGCRLLQKAFEEASSDDVRVGLASELRTHVWEVLKCPNANHVLQICISTMRPLESQFIINEIQQAGFGGAGGAARSARHRYGCRILQRLIEHCSAEQVHALVEELLCDVVGLSTHTYGNYVLQHILEHGTEGHIARMTQALAEHASTVGANLYGCAVLGKAFEHASLEARGALANMLVKDHDLIATMACSRHGHLTVKLALQASQPSQKWAALSALEARNLNSRYGRVLNKYVEKCMEDERAAESN